MSSAAQIRIVNVTGWSALLEYLCKALESFVQVRQITCKEFKMKSVIVATLVACGLAVSAPAFANKDLAT